MLQTIDVLIGFSMVMLVLSVLVTMLVQFVISTLLNLKGKVLKEGIAHLLNLLERKNLTAGETMEIADHLLRDARGPKAQPNDSAAGRVSPMAGWPTRSACW